MQIHPAAECFRLMHDDELAALAETIKENGLRDPITLGRVNGNKTHVLVDGRNRLRACEIAGVEPRFETIEFADDAAVIAFVRDRGERRDVTKGERAMAHAMLYPEAKHGGARKKASSETELGNGFSKALLANARAVLAHSPVWARAVRDGAMKLDEALAKVKEERDALQSDAGKLHVLREKAPDLAALVEEDRMKLSEAFAAYQRREQDAIAAEENKRETLYRLTESAYRGVLAWSSEGFQIDVHERLADDGFRTTLLERIRVDPSHIKNIEQGARELADVLGKLTKR